MMGQFERLCQQMLLLKKHIEIDKKLFSKGEQSELDAAYKKCSSLQNTYNQLTEELKASESSSQESKIQSRIENEVLKGVKKKVEGWLSQTDKISKLFQKYEGFKQVCTTVEELANLV